MVYNVSSGSVLLNFSDNLTQEVLFLEILVPISHGSSLLCKNIAKKSNDRQDWKKFKDLRKAGKRKLAEARNNYVLNLLDLPNEDGPPKTSKRFWSYIKSTRKDNLGVGTLKSGNAEITNSE